jgi:hypothetical protein
MNSHRKRIKERIKNSISKFQSKSIDFYELTTDIVTNIKALDNLDYSLEQAVITLCGELEVIHYTVAPDKEHELMLKELKNFENFLSTI